MPAPPVDPVIDPSVEDVKPEAGLPDELLVEAEPHPEEAVEPPPSKAEFEGVLEQGICSGLMPGVFISVAPSLRRPIRISIQKNCWMPTCL